MKCKSTGSLVATFLGTNKCCAVWPLALLSSVAILWGIHFLMGIAYGGKICQPPGRKVFDLL